LIHRNISPNPVPTGLPEGSRKSEIFKEGIETGYEQDELRMPEVNNSLEWLWWCAGMYYGAIHRAKEAGLIVVDEETHDGAPFA
jgi:hypothetical protein